MMNELEFLIREITRDYYINLLDGTVRELLWASTLPIEPGDEKLIEQFYQEFQSLEQEIYAEHLKNPFTLEEGIRLLDMGQAGYNALNELRIKADQLIFDEVSKAMSATRSRNNKCQHQVSS